MGKIDIRKPSGEVINAELISFFEVINISKKYIFYSLNEIVENGLVKMYVAEVVDSVDMVKIGQTMTDDEWSNLKLIMKQILTGSRDENIKYLKIEGV